MKIRKINQSAGVVANVVNDLNSTSEIDALSAAAGKELNDKIMLIYTEADGLKLIAKDLYIKNSIGDYVSLDRISQMSYHEDLTTYNMARNRYYVLGNFLGSSKYTEATFYVSNCYNYGNPYPLILTYSNNSTSPIRVKELAPSPISNLTVSYLMKFMVFEGDVTGRRFLVVKTGPYGDQATIKLLSFASFNQHDNNLYFDTEEELKAYMIEHAGSKDTIMNTVASVQDYYDE